MTSRIEPILGRYLHLDIFGRPHRIYFEEAGSGTPILFLHGARDQVIPPKSAAAAIAALDGHAEVREYLHGYHMLLRDLEGAKVQDDVAGWVLAH